MKLFRWGKPGAEKPGMLDSQGRMRSLEGIVEDFTPTTLAAGAIETARAVEPDSLPILEEIPRLGPCVGAVRDFHCVGLNYAKHARESGQPIPDTPTFFSKASTALSGPNDTIRLAPEADKVDWEVELGVIIGGTTERVSVEEALTAVAGYCVINDVSDRRVQFEGLGQWYAGKSAPTYGPIGPWLVTADEIPDPQALALRLDINGSRMQDGHTGDMVFGVAEIISKLSHRLRLSPGDVIATGTPEGVGSGQKPPRFLRDGDVISLGVEGLGEQRQTVRQG